MTQKIALITGASRGLGAGLAEALCQTHHIVAVARTTGALEELDDRIQAKGGQATLAPMDITNKDAMAQLCRSIYDRWGAVDVWAHTAVHVAPLAPANFVDQKDWEKSVACNVSATGVLIPYIAPLLGESGTALFFEDARAGQKFFGAYGATKAAQIAMARPRANAARALLLCSANTPGETPKGRRGQRPFAATQPPPATVSPHPEAAPTRPCPLPGKTARGWPWPWARGPAY